MEGFFKKIICFLFFISIITATKAQTSSRLKEEYYRHRIADNSISEEIRLAYFDSLILLDKENSRDLLLEKSAFALKSGLYPESLSAIDIILETSDSLPLPFLLKVKDKRIETLFFNKKYEEATKEAISLKGYNKPDTLIFYDALALLHLQNITQTFDLSALRNKYMSEIHQILGKFDKKNLPKELNEFIKYRTELTEISLNTSNGNNTKSLDLIKNTMARVESPETKGKLLNEMGVLLCQQQEYEKGAQFFQDAYSFVSNTDKSVVLFNLLMSQFDRGLYEEMILEFDKNQTVLEDLSFANKGELYQSLSKAAASLNNYYRAYDSLNKSTIALAANDSIRRELIDYLTNNDVMMVDSPAVTSKDGSLWAIFVLMFIIILFPIDIYYLRSKEKKKNDISEQNCENLLQEKLNSRNEELASLTMQIGRMNEFIMAIRREIERKDSSSTTLSVRINSLLKDIDSLENVWESWLYYFEEANKDFFKNLYNLNPSLSKSEIRMSAFCLMGLTVKEIAVITNRSVRTIESIRYTLRKKLGITENTDAFMRRLASSEYK